MKHSWTVDNGSYVIDGNLHLLAHNTQNDEVLDLQAQSPQAQSPQVHPGDQAYAHIRNQEILKIGEEIGEVNQLFQWADEIVNSQAPLLDNIEDAIEVSVSNTAGGVQHLQEAEQKQIKKRKRRCCCFIVIVVILAALIVFILLSVKK